MRKIGVSVCRTHSGQGMDQDPLVFTFFLIFTGAAVMAALALFARQSLLIAYVLLGVLLGPSVLGLVDKPELVEQISHIGIIFLLFLLGLNLNPGELLNMVRKTTLVTIASSAVFALGGVLVSLAFGFSWTEALVIGAVTTFSSTIIGLKLLPTSVLHHRRTGEVIISILLLQDLLAILLLVVIKGGGGAGMGVWEPLLLVLKLPLLVVFAWFMTRYLIVALIRRFDRIQEFIFLMAIGWCLGMAEFAYWLGLSAEIGAFIAGVSLATGPVALFVSESLKPLRDFFLVLFFFSLGAQVDLAMALPVMLPALVLALMTMIVKPPVFRWLMQRIGESALRSRNIGIRLGQMSEFSLLISVVALQAGVIGEKAAYLIQFATLFTFIASSWWIVQKLPTPIALKDELRLD
jgi:Kef-type K+ transport system membrane component KefB